MLKETVGNRRKVVELAEYKQNKKSKMTEETIILILLVVVMLVGSYLAGSIPLVMKLSEVCIVRTLNQSIKY